MSTDLINEDEKKGYTLTRFWGGNGVKYQITQEYKTLAKDDSQEYLRTIIGDVCVTESDLRYMLSVIEKDKQQLIEQSLETLKKVKYESEKNFDK